VSFQAIFGSKLTPTYCVGDLGASGFLGHGFSPARVGYVCGIPEKSPNTQDHISRVFDTGIGRYSR